MFFYPAFSILALLLIAFLIGAVPVGFIVSRIKGIDIRAHGSGNTGATNVARALGKKAGIITLLVDALKGVLAILIPITFSNIILSPAAGLPIEPGLGLAAIFGHCFSPFLHFRGGKGVATSLGVYLLLSPGGTLVAAAVFLSVFSATKYVSLSSISASLALVVAIAMGAGTSYENNLTLLASIVSCTLIMLRHVGNISRIVSGEEPRFGDKAPEAS